MPGYKYKFKSTEYFEETILDENNSTIGTIRIKPSTILWKPKNHHDFFSIPINQFHEWMIHDKTEAKKVSS